MSIATQVVPVGIAVAVEEVPDPQVAERARRRSYTAKYKASILAEYERLDRDGRGALLRREGLYSSLISEWRKQAGRGALEALGRTQGRPPADPVERDAAIRSSVGKLVDMAEQIRARGLRSARHLWAFADGLSRLEIRSYPDHDELLVGVDACVHLAAQALEGDWPTVLHSNIIAGINLWEAARKEGTKRILFASSNHAIGFWPRTETLDHTTPAKPDSRYGLSKAFGEDLGLYYANKHGIACFSMRIGSCYPEPADARMLSTWLSYRDFCQLIEVGLTADYRYEIVYGVSANKRSWWDNANAHRLGYRPQDNAEDYAAEVEKKITGTALDQRFQGGGFISPDFTGDPDRIV